MPDLTLLFNDLIRFETRLWDAVDARLRNDVGVQLTWFESMRVISTTDCCRVNDIADALAITIGGVSKLVDRIEAAGYCRRRANPGDRRSSIIELTPVGKRLMTRLNRAFEAELNDRIGTAVPSGEMDQFISTLAYLHAAMADGGADPSRARVSPQTEKV